MSVKVIAEIGCNHKGDIKVAKQLIKEAKRCGANVAKFQKRNNKELLSKEQYNAPHPNPSNSYGITYGEHREFLEFTLEQHMELKEYCHKIGIIYSTSVWDITSAKEISSLNPEFIKIPSAMNNHYELLAWLCDNYKGEIHVSTGMTNYQEIESLINFFIEKKRNKSLVVYNCTSGYPVPFEDIRLKEISRLREKYCEVVKAIGFSGHHLGIAVDIAAVTMGAEWIERHFTLDRTWKGTDHGASLEPRDFKQLVQDIKNVELALQYKKEEILEIEHVQRTKLKYRGEK
ncbi:MULTISPECIES: N-acetylneuraminate synthase family protein [Lysinibacillus]|uniref:N-acetylneuraminate synthase family protein n=1 Tax=Lysinibacillus TaxID=400634 RepID=UPI000824F473|nr:MULTISPECIES: N-acetylneuraminate synthase family protein [Lysinibacillus]MEC1305748.1 N-acetylneuraminate synthase family protein [Lysinibacillus capsici]OCX65250.1 N-acetylneuraminate synthase [Lysinibacillus sp. AR18-8]